MAITEEILLLLLILVFVAAWIFIKRQRFYISDQETKYSKKLKDTQSKLAEYIADLDSLIVMLVGIHEFGMAATGIVSKEELTQSVIDSACKLIKSDAGSLMLLN